MRAIKSVKLYITILTFFLCQLTTYSSNFIELCFNGGYTKFNDTINNSFFLGSELRLTTIEGLGCSIEGNYLKTTNIDDSNFRNIPITIGLSYNLNPKKSISPYIGGGISANFLNQPYKSPLLGYKIKAGFNFRVAKSNILYIELFKNFLKDEQNNLDQEPLSLKAGLSFIILKPNPEHFQNPTKKVQSNRLLKKQRKKLNRQKRIKKRRNKRINKRRDF